jgi:hypothetical protein
MPATVPVLEQQGPFYADALAGNVFTITNAAAGVALTASAGTTQNFGILNPAGSGKNLVPIRFKAQPVGATIGTQGGFVYNYLTGANYPAATGGKVTTFTETAGAIMNHLLGYGNVPVAKGAVTAGGIVCVAPTLLETSTISFNVITAATATNMPVAVGEQFSGDLIIPPGTLFIVCGLVVDAAAWVMSLTWAERLLGV